MSYLGIDITSGDKPYSFAVVGAGALEHPLSDGVAGVSSVGWVPPSLDGVLALVAETNPDVIAIDGPSGIPNGLVLACCFADNPQCDHVAEGLWHGRPRLMRFAEYELRALGIGVYPTSRSSPAHWKRIVRDLAVIWPALADLGYVLGTTLIETYPHGVWRRLFPNSQFQWTGGIKNDTYDAILCAMAGLFHHRHQSESLGDPAEGCIVVPHLPVGAL